MKHHQENYALKIFKNLANANRIKIIKLLATKKNITVNQICDELGLEQGKVSNHLAKMRSDGILTAKQDGWNMYYSIKDENSVKILSLLIK